MCSVLLLLVLALAGVSACSDSDGPGPRVARPAPVGEERTVQLGFGALPAARSRDAYIDAFATAARYGEAIVIQRAPPWADFLPGGRISTETQAETRLETDLLDQYSRLTRFYAIDPTDPGVRRARLADPPAGAAAEEGFTNPDVRRAFINYTAYVTKNYRPDYLALGVEINMLYERSPDQFAAFVTLYEEAYAVAKAASPRTKVFPTFQLEDLLGRLDMVHQPHWEVLDFFRGKMDAFAVTTFPYFGAVRSTEELDPAYYSQLRQHFEGEILIAQAGYPSLPVESRAVIGTEPDQEAFVARLLDDAEGASYSFVLWIAARDPSFAQTGSSAVVRDTGLRKSDGSNKLAWTTWEAWALRPVKP